MSRQGGILLVRAARILLLSAHGEGRRHVVVVPHLRVRNTDDNRLLISLGSLIGERVDKRKTEKCPNLQFYQQSIVFFRSCLFEHVSEDIGSARTNL